ncbi:hypothetical protein pEaSNUABM35_00209 [Erwinia phage pEa_SNUABM_35]|uniref:Uncharacterized protein n=1 Tax=Erwinia phage pEa_SNUABM_35 TaxID=2869557 RepID=A0AAE7XPA8_9CAUD|nr:hypothetical protein MPK65_gp209 [Erwinia phage pEa_SNUABM_35]QZE60126.1 hypothetical protein pEaSNUABM35_00209 [Erwinia phage pEa_SNUABM_35]QZE60462.1 hypothetical protein pEaSNUABM36_00209 [Erwinia phage pEa_SNUABM_36]
MSDDDFHFEFGADDDSGYYIDQPLHMIMDGEDAIVGHLVDSGDTVLMYGGYFIVDDDETEDTTVLIEVPIFKVDPLSDIILVTNADEMRLRFNSELLTLAFINDIPLVVKSTRH